MSSLKNAWAAGKVSCHGRRMTNILELSRKGARIGFVWFCTLKKPCAAISQKNFHAQQHELDEQSERKDNVSDMFESCLEHFWTQKMMPKHEQSWSNMKGNPKAVPVCILSVELRKLEVCDFGRFRFRIHLNPPEVLWCWRGPLGTIPCLDSISVGWNSTDVDNVQE